jgi:hypothetical protein
MKKIGLLILAIIFSSAPASAAISIKLRGGLTFLLQNDYNRGMKGLYDYYGDSQQGMAGQYKLFSFGQDYSGEIIISPWRNMGIGFGSGFLQAGVLNNVSYRDLTYTIRESYEPRLRVIPLTLNIHAFFPLSRRLWIDIYGGAGYYLAKFNQKSGREADFFSYSETRTFDAETNTVGLQGGLGLELRLGSHFGFCAEIDGRYAEFSNVLGNWSERIAWFLGEADGQGGDAPFWFYEKNVSGTTYPQVAFSGTRPADPSFGNIRKGTLSLSGISASAGAKITF